MLRLFLLMAIFSLRIAPNSLASTTAAIVRDGRADLRQWNPEVENIIDLEGQWEFYWSQLLTPDDFKNQKANNRTLIHVPGSWSRVADYPDKGFASYRLRVNLAAVRELAMFIPSISSSTRVYIDDKLVHTAGRISTINDKRLYESGTREKYVIFTPSKAEFEIVVQAASYEMFIAGIGASVKLGTPDAIDREKDLTAAIGIFVIGSLFIMGIYHLCLFALRTKARSTLYFGLILLCICCYLFAGRGSSIALFFPELSYVATLRLFCSFIPAVVGFAYFIHDLFPKHFAKKVARWIASICLPLFAIILTTDSQFFLPLIIIAQTIILALCFYAAYALTKAVRAAEDGARLFATGSVVVTLAAVHDVFLASGWFQSIALSPFALFLFIFVQSVLLARRFSNAFVRVEKSEQAIRQLSGDLRVERDQVLRLNESLEQKVEEKTRDIRSIMTHIPLGIFAITIDHYKIHKDYSEHLHDLLEVKNLVGLDACPLLFDSTQLSSDEKSQAISVLDACLGEELLMFEMNAHSLPRELRRRRIAGDERILELTWNPMTRGDGCIEKILVTLRDVTELRALEEDAHDKRDELQFIGELLNVSSDVFRRFINSCQAFIAENRKLLNAASIDSTDIEVLKVLFINMHTMKGAARSLYFKKMTRIFHDVEQYYANLQRFPDVKWDLTRMHRDIDEVDAIVSIYSDINKHKLGRKTDDERDIEFPESQVLLHYQNLLTVSIRVKHLLDQKTHGMLRDMRRWIFPKIFTSARETILDCCLCVDTLARDLEKAKPKIALTSPNIFLSSRGEDLLRNIFVHILRNTMDHGLERPLDRAALGKDPAGLITITLTRISGGVSMRIYDDGRGLNISKIRAIGESRGLLASQNDVNAEEVAELIFCSGLSTAGKVSDVSGRGVGMQAVRTFLLHEDGNIKIHLQPPKEGSPDYYPFHFEIYLPDCLFAVTGEDLLPAAA